MGKIIYFFISHPLIIFAALILIAIFLWLMKFEKKLNLKWKEALLVALVHVIVGWSCMRLLAIMEAGGDLKKAANIRLYGAIFVLPFLYYAWAKLTKRNTALVMDIAAVCVIFGAISGRLNCLTSGCCQGTLMFNSDTLRWPIRGLELIFYTIFLMYYCGKIMKRKTHGEVYSIYLISYGVLRLICEFVRVEFTTQVGVFHLAHIWSMISIAAGALLYYRVCKNQADGKAIKISKKNKEGTRK